MRFDLSKYSTVAERLAQFHEDWPDGRIVTEWENNNRFEVEPETKGAKTWVIRTKIYLSAGDQAHDLAKATGYAFEVDGGSGANQTSALENAETSSIGRALMVMGYSMNKESNSLASREEMEKVQRHRNWLEEASKLTDVNALRLLWAEAKAAKVSETVLDEIKELANANTEGQHSRTAGSPATSKAKSTGK
jgi:hypothetical protein